MALTREERRLLHQKSQQPTFGSGKPNSREGNHGDISFRKVEGSGTVQYLKEGGDWTAISSTGEMPAIRITGGGGGGSSGVSHHASLNGLNSDDHAQYLLINGSRAMTSVMTIGADSDGTDRSITWGHSTLKTIMGIDDSADAFVINTDDAFDATLANNSFSIDASHNVIIAGGVTSGSSGYTVGSTVITDDSIVMTPSTDDTVTIAASPNGRLSITTVDDAGANGNMTLTADGTMELDGTTITLDSSGDIVLDPAGGDVYVKTASSVDPSIQFNSNSTDYWRIGVDTSDSNKFKIDGTTVTSLANNSYFELGTTEDAGEGITLTGDGLQFNTDVEYLYATGGRMTIGNVALGLRVGPPVAFTSATGLAHGDEQTTYDSFGIRWKTLTGGTYNGQHIAGGEADYKNNYSMIGMSTESAKFADESTTFVLRGG